MATIFQALPNNRNPLLVLLGIVPHRIVPADERFKPSSFLITVHQVDQLLKNAVDVGICTNDEAGEFRAQAVAAGLPIDVRAFIARAFDQQVEGELGELSFRLCEHDECTALPGIRHGRFYHGDTELTEQIGTVSEAFEALQELVDEGVMIDCTPQQAILLLRQVREFNLPFDQVELKERYAALPEETKAAYHRRLEEIRRAELEKVGIRVNHLEEFTGMRGMLVEIDLGRLLGGADEIPSTPAKNWLERMMDRIRTGR